MTKNKDQDLPAPFYAIWRGLGLWNLYFIVKLFLYWAGLLNFHAFYNLIFACALLLPLPPLWLHRLRHLLAIPVGAALFYYDTWFPPISRLLAQPDVLNFSTVYLLELAQRFINWDLVGAGFVLLVVYLFLSQWLRLTIFSMVALVGTSLAGVISLPASLWGTQPAVMAQGQAVAPAAGITQPPEPVAGKPLNEQLNQALQDFYAAEKKRITQFPVELGDAAAFDVLLLNICSLSWSDLEASNLRSHPIFQKMDVVFNNFNSATSYSGPAVLRLMRASCGQESHHDLYEPVDDQCYLFENLKRLGFSPQTALNHNGQFQGFIEELTAGGRFPAPFIPKDSKRRWSAFDDSPIWDDRETLQQWWRNRLASGQKNAALLYNTITLHDGNREITSTGGSRSAPFQNRAQVLLDELDAFMDELESSGRRVLVILVPEHGAALVGDKMQISGMREIPAPSITNVPVGVRLIGGKKTQQPRQTLRIDEPSSHLAISELLSRLLAAHAFEQDTVDWASLTSGLPQTLAVSENEGTVLMPYQGVPYVRMGGRDWIPYPR